MLVHFRVTPSSMSPVLIYTPWWRGTNWSTVPCLRKQCNGQGLNPGPPDPEFEVLTTRPHTPSLRYKWLKKRSLFWFNYLMAYSNSYFSLGICQASEKKLISKNWSNHQQVMMMMFSTGQTDHSSGDGNAAYGCE